MIITIKKLNVLSFALMQAKLVGLVGLLLGIIYAFGGLILDCLISIDILTTNESLGLSEGTLLAFGSLVGMPLIGIACGFALGIAEAILFNLTSRIIGMLKLEYRL